jgi:spore germination protein YaaH
MDRQFFFGSPFFFPRRRLFPFFFFFPFFFPFFRGEEDRDGMYYTHTCGEGDTMRKLAKKYNVPQPVLEAMNQHIQNPAALRPRETVYVPRMDKMYCQKMYMEEGEIQMNQPMMPYTAMPSSMYPAQQMIPYPNQPVNPYPNMAMPAPTHANQ